MRRLMPSPIQTPLQNTGECRNGVFICMVKVACRKFNSERKYEEKRILSPFVSLQSCPDYP